MPPKAVYQRRRRAAIKAGTWKKESKIKTSPSTLSTYNELRDKTYNVDSPEFINNLREMASRGEFPAFIDASSRESRERFYEEFNRLYPEPPGILNDYRIETDLRGRSAQVYFNYNLAEAESPGHIRFLRGANTTEEVKAGQIKHAIYVQRSAVEFALSSRMGEFPSYDLAKKYGGRVLSKLERDEADRAIYQHVEGLLKSPMTARGKWLNAEEWLERDGGYIRKGTDVR